MLYIDFTLREVHLWTTWHSLKSQTKVKHCWGEREEVVCLCHLLHQLQSMNLPQKIFFVEGKVYNRITSKYFTKSELTRFKIGWGIDTNQFLSFKAHQLKSNYVIFESIFQISIWLKLHFLHSSFNPPILHLLKQVWPIWISNLIDFHCRRFQTYQSFLFHVTFLGWQVSDEEAAL